MRNLMMMVVLLSCCVFLTGFATIEKSFKQSMSANDTQRLLFAPRSQGYPLMELMRDQLRPKVGQAFDHIRYRPGSDTQRLGQNGRFYLSAMLLDLVDGFKVFFHRFGLYYRAAPLMLQCFVFPRFGLNPMPAYRLWFKLK